MARQSVKKPLVSSIKYIHQIQTKAKSLVRTNREWLDTIGGILPQSVITIVATSFGGKSTELENLKADIMNTELNPSADNYVWLSNSYEMTALSTTLRDLRKVVGKSFKDIFAGDFSKEEQEKIREYTQRKTDGRFFINYETNTPDEFFTECDSFLKEHQNKEAVFIDIDHAALMKSSQEGKKSAIDDMAEKINTLKLKYSNVYFIILSQLNRNIDARLEEKSNRSRILRSDIYQSDTLFHLSDYLYGLQNAHWLGIDQYRKISAEKYPNLEHRFADSEDKNGKVSLLTEGCIFVEVLKDRTADNFDYCDLFTIEFKNYRKGVNKKTISEPTFK